MIVGFEPHLRSCLPACPRITAKALRVNMDAVGGFATETACVNVDHCERHARKRHDHRSAGWSPASTITEQSHLMCDPYRCHSICGER